jgi:hypothetical protein
MKPFLRALARMLLPVGAVKTVNADLCRVSGAGHCLRYKLEWHTAKHTPERFDHHIDQYWKWNRTGNPLSWERSMFGLLPIRDGACVLALCFGRGFFAHHFFAPCAAKVVSVDFNPFDSADPMTYRRHMADTARRHARDIT